jgi:phosphatidylglycerol:prolipoprotein diacylglycerol transferase
MYPPFGPVLVELGPLTLRWYGVLMMVAIGLAIVVAGREVARRGLDPNTLYDMVFWVLIPAGLGARLYYVFIQSPRTPEGIGRFLENPLLIFQIWTGGIHIFGAFIFGGIALVLYCRWRKLPTLVYLDALAVALPLAQAVGRLGNFINQELYGPPTTLPWGLRIDPDHRIPPYNDLTTYPESTRFHSLFLYESAWNFIGFGLLFWISRRFIDRLLPGDLILLYLIWYPLGRFLIEFLRTDSWFFPGTPFNTVHLLSAVAVVGAAITLIVRHTRRPSAISHQPSA